MVGLWRRGIEGGRGEALGFWIAYLVVSAMEVAAPPGAPMHGSGRHRKPDLILLAEGLICPRGERGTRPRSRSVGRSGWENIMMKQENSATSGSFTRSKTAPTAAPLPALPLHRFYAFSPSSNFPL